MEISLEQCFVTIICISSLTVTSQEMSPAFSSLTRFTF